MVCVWGGEKGRYITKSFLTFWLREVRGTREDPNELPRLVLKWFKGFFCRKTEGVLEPDLAPEDPEKFQGPVRWAPGPSHK